MEFVGAPGTGHFLTLVHNAIEFGMVQPIAGGVELLERSGFSFDLPPVFDNWNHASVIRSCPSSSCATRSRTIPTTTASRPMSRTRGEIKWMLEWAMRGHNPSRVISDSQQALMAYRDLDWRAAKAVALLRRGYGGHPVHVADEQPVRS